MGGPSAGLDDVEKREFFILPGLELWLVIQLVASRYTDYAIPIESYAKINLI
jgi:hypothetical protein